MCFLNFCAQIDSPGDNDPGRQVPMGGPGALAPAPVPALIRTMERGERVLGWGWGGKGGGKGGTTWGNGVNGVSDQIALFVS